MTNCWQYPKNVPKLFYKLSEATARTHFWHFRHVLPIQQGPKMVNSQKWLGEGAKGLLGPGSKSLPRVCGMSQILIGNVPVGRPGPRLCVYMFLSAEVVVSSCSRPPWVVPGAYKLQQLILAVKSLWRPFEAHKDSTRSCKANLKTSTMATCGASAELLQDSPLTKATPSLSFGTIEIREIPGWSHKWQVAWISQVSSSKQIGPNPLDFSPVEPRSPLAKLEKINQTSPNDEAQETQRPSLRPQSIFQHVCTNVCTKNPGKAAFWTEKNRLPTDTGEHGISKHAEREQSSKHWTCQHVYSEDAGLKHLPTGTCTMKTERNFPEKLWMPAWSSVRELPRNVPNNFQPRSIA